jgi:hypothetical protein
VARTAQRGGRGKAADSSTDDEDGQRRCV